MRPRPALKGGVSAGSAAAHASRAAVLLPAALGARLPRIDSRLPAVAAVAARVKTDDPGHDWSHILRVAHTCLELGEATGAELELLLPAALLHDAVNLPKNHPQRRQASSLSAERARALLSGLGYSDAEAAQIGQIIREHSFTLGAPPSTLESAVLQDADRLDAVGAVGVMRAVTCGVRLGASYYDLSDPRLTIRQPEDERFMLDHFHRKLLHLEEAMNTEPAKRKARQRITFLRVFLKQLEEEVTPCDVFEFPGEARGWDGY